MALPLKYILLKTVGNNQNWTVPNDWNSAYNQIHLIGGGGGGGTAGQTGAGGGGYTLIYNFQATPGATIRYSIGAGGAIQTNGGLTNWNTNPITWANMQASGGGGGNSIGGGTGGTGYINNNMTQIGTTSSGGQGSGASGSGGAAGPNGAGGAGGAGTGGSGDAGFGGAGNAAAGSAGYEIWPGIAGSGGGGGSTGGAGGLYGGGGGTSGAGAQGAIIIVYMPANSGYTANDPTYGLIDFDDKYVTDPWLIDQFVGSGLWHTGDNFYGAAGQNNLTNQLISSPTLVSVNQWRQVGVGFDWCASVKTDGSLWTWGHNQYGQLGQNNITNYSSPIQVGLLTNWRLISCGRYHSLGIKNDGTMWTWGYNGLGQLGQNNVTNYSSPLILGGLTNWKQATGTEFHSGAIKTDGTLWAWGQNSFGQLGLGDITHRSSPVQVGLLTNWKYVNMQGYKFTMAIKTDGTLWSWGQNSFGELGLNSTAVTTYSSPMQVGSMTNWKQVSAGESGHTAAIKTDGTLWAWGQNAYGQLGQNNLTNYSSPVQIGSMTNWKQVASGYYHMTAVKTDGTVWAWGYNSSGQLGLIDNVARSSPVQIGLLTNWRRVESLGLFTSLTSFADIT